MITVCTAWEKAFIAHLLHLSNQKNYTVILEDYFVQFTPIKKLRKAQLLSTVLSLGLQEMEFRCLILDCAPQMLHPDVNVPSKAQFRDNSMMRVTEFHSGCVQCVGAEI